MNNKIILSILVLVGLFSCTNNKERTLLRQFEKSLKSEYDLTKSRIDRTLELLAPMNNEIKLRVIHVDSLYQIATKGIEAAPTATIAENRLKEFCDRVESDVAIYLEDSLPRLPQNFYQEYGKMELNILGRKILNDLGIQIGAQELKFDKIKIFIESDEIDPNLTRVYLATYASNTDKIMKMYADNEEIEIVNGVGQLKHVKDFSKSVNIKIESTSEYGYWKDWSMEQVIEK